MPPEETLDPGVVSLSDEAIHVHPSSRSSSPVIGHRDHRPKRRKHNVNDALPQEFTAARSKIDAEGAATETEPAARTGGAHRSQRRAPAAAAAKSTEAGGSSSKDDDKASASVGPPASSRFIRFKHSSSLAIGGSSEQRPAAGSSSGGGHSSCYANNHAVAASSSSSRLIVREPAAQSSHLPKKRRPPSGIVPREPDKDAEYFGQGVVAFGSLDVAAQLAEVNNFMGVGQQPQPQPLPEGGGFSFWLTPQQAEADLAYVYDKVNAARREAKRRQD
jgi:hypothetical protein